MTQQQQLEDITLEQVLESTHCTSLLREYLQRIHNVELLDFLTDYQEQNMSTSELITVYVKPGAKKELNIQQSLRCQVLSEKDPNYDTLKTLYSPIKLLLKESAYPGFMKSADYKQLLVEHYPKESVLECLLTKDLSEWNPVEVYLYLYHQQMSYILENNELLGRIPNVNGAQLFMFIDEDLIRVSHLLQLRHVKLLKKLVDGPTTITSEALQPTPTPRRRTISFNCSYQNRVIMIQMDRQELSQREDLAISRLKGEIRKLFNLSGVLNLKMKDSEGDYLNVRTFTDLKYILNDTEVEYQVKVLTL